MLPLSCLCIDVFDSISENASVDKSRNTSTASDGSYLTPRPLCGNEPQDDVDETPRGALGNVKENADSDSLSEERHCTSKVENLSEGASETGTLKSVSANGVTELDKMESKKFPPPVAVFSCDTSSCLSEKRLAGGVLKEGSREDERHSEVKESEALNDYATNCVSEKRETEMDSFENEIDDDCGSKGRIEPRDEPEKRDSSIGEFREMTTTESIGLSTEREGIPQRDFADRLGSDLSNTSQEFSDVLAGTSADLSSGKSANDSSVMENSAEMQGIGSPVSIQSEDQSTSIGPPLDDVDCKQRGGGYVTEDGYVEMDDIVDKERSTYTVEESERNDGAKAKSWQSSQVTSTPKLDRSDSSQKKIFEGNFCGQAKHKDGSLLSIVFQVRLRICMFLF